MESLHPCVWATLLACHSSPPLPPPQVSGGLSLLSLVDVVAPREVHGSARSHSQAWTSSSGVYVVP